MTTQDLQFILERLADETKPVRSLNLSPLSDVPRTELVQFREAWAGLRRERRVELLLELVERAESNIHMNFTVILRELLSDVDARVRKLAVEGLWEDNRPTLVRPLVTLAKHDPAPEVRAAAAMSLNRFVLLGALGEISQAMAELAEQALRDAWFRRNEITEVRRRALEGLAYSDDPDVREFIHNAYYDDDELMRQSAVFAMGRSADNRWARFVLTELGNSNPAMRFEAATAAGELSLAPAVGHLIHLLDDPDSNVREASALALGQIGGPKARRALQEATASDDQRLADAADEALSELNFNSGELEMLAVPDNGALAREIDDDDIEDVDDDIEDDLDDGLGAGDDDFLEEIDDFDGDGEDAGWYDEDDEDDEDDEAGWN